MMNQIIKSLFDRKSIRAYLDKEITAEEKRLIIDSAIQAPTAGNMYLYSIIDVVDQSVKEKLAVLCDNQQFIAKAAMVLVFLADYQRNYELFKTTVDNDVETPKLGSLMLACSDANIAAQNAVIAAESMGIGSCYIGDIIMYYDEVKELLNLADYTFPACMLVFGYPTQQQKQRVKPLRLKAEDIVYQDKYEIKDDKALEIMYQNQREDFDYRVIGEKIYKSKHDTEFLKKMNETVEKYLEKWR